MAGDEGPGRDRYRVEAAADDELLGALHALADRVAAEHPDVAEADRTRLFTAAAEVAANVVRHARADRAVLELAVDPDGVTLVVLDDGPPAPEGLLDALDLPGPSAESGRGLPLAAACLDELDVTTGADGNRWTLRRHRR